VQAAAHSLEKPQGGAGVLLGAVPGVLPATVLVIGGGIVGVNAARMAMGLGAKVIVMDKALLRLRVIDELFEGRISTLYSTQQNLEAVLPQCDAVIGAVLVPGATAPRLIRRDMLGIMKPGSVLVDVAIDQGGCFESSKPTSHKAPTYIVDKVVHYCVANIPGAVPYTSTLALTNATLPWVLALADKGESALGSDGLFRGGVNIARKCVTHPAVAESLELEYYSVDALLKN
jgi:alanine dehydrogenase